MNVTQTQRTSAAGTDSSKAASPKLATAAKQFESVLLGQWLQAAESSFASVPGGDADSDSGGEQMQGFATQHLATSLTASGGIGIAKLVGGALARAGEREYARGATAASAATGAVAAYAAETKR